VSIVAGQFLNFSVCYRLGKIRVLYGNKVGDVIPWCREFPFSLLHRPQYVGTLLSIWGFFWQWAFPMTIGTFCLLFKQPITLWVPILGSREEQSENTRRWIAAGAPPPS
jgi:hypothetical protein